MALPQKCMLHTLTQITGTGICHKILEKPVYEVNSSSQQTVHSIR